jgi:hypothetical protein
MANFNSAFKTSQLETLYKREVSPDMRKVQGLLRYARFEYTFAGTEATTDTITLGSLGIPGRVIPELSRIRDTGGAQDIDVSVKLNVLLGGETSTDLSGTVAFDNASIAFTEIATTALVLVGANDDLRLVINDGSIGAVTAGETVEVEIAYVSEAAV